MYVKEPPERPKKRRSILTFFKFLCIKTFFKNLKDTVIYEILFCNNRSIKPQIFSNNRLLHYTSEGFFNGHL